MATLRNCINSARLSWQSNYVTGDEKWRLKQLHQLYHLLLDNRDELISALIQAHSESPEAGEHEIALLVREIHLHIRNVTSTVSPPVIESVQLGELNSTLRPYGVSVIVCGRRTPLRFVVGTLAASIAAGNISIVATVAGQEDPLVACLARIWPEYLDTQCIFLSSGFREGDFTADDVDLISIYDVSSKPYASLSSFSNARYCSTAPGLKLVVITEGKKAWKAVLNEITSMSSLRSSADRIDAVFVQSQDLHFLRRSLDSYTILDATADGVSCVNFGASLQSSRDSGSLLLVVVESLERVIDILVGVSEPVQQLAFLGQKARQQAQYAQNWVPTAMIAVDFIYPFSVPACHGLASPNSNLTMFPSSDFSHHVFLTKTPPQLPLSIAALRKSYESLLVPLKPEPRGERIGFFTQAEYLVKGVGAVAALLSFTCLYFGARWVQRRL